MNKAIISVIALLVLFVVGGLLLRNTSKPKNDDVSAESDSVALATPEVNLAPTEEPLSESQVNGNIDPMDITELLIEDITEGTGDEAVAGKQITVNYKGTLLNGIVFDSSYPRGVPFDFELGAGSVIEGWDKGLVGMKVGGKRKLTIPAEMAYGEQAVGKIPANSPLIFEVELLKVE